MNCQEFQEKLLEPTTLAAFDQNPEASAHAAACAECRRLLEWNRKVAEGFSAMSLREPPAILRDRILRIPELVTREDASAKPVAETETAWFPGWRWLSGMGLSFAGAFLLYVLVVRPFDMGTAVREDSRPTTKGMQVSAVPPASVSEAVRPSPEPVIPALQPTSAEAKPPDTGAAVPSSPAIAIEVAKVPTVSTAKTTASSLPVSAPASAVAIGRVAVDEASTAMQVAAAPMAPEPKNRMAVTENQEPPATEMAFAPPPPKVVGTPLNTVVGEPLVPTADAPSASVSTAAGAGNTSPGASKSEEPIVLAQTENKGSQFGLADKRPSFTEGEILLREAVPADAEEAKAGSLDDQPLLDTSATSDQFAREFRASKKETTAMPTQQALPDLETRKERLLAIVQKHSDKVIEGPIDLNQWILAGWITVKERISLAAPQGRTWVTQHEDGQWKIELEP
ncbi:MAG TPA: hypothetical protein PKO06_03655 [Candidatus Ozemobacteraceae bacterium]|nr:hypothetical protein [Candidatus Ozemobacteraceae bacterium]